MEQEKNKYAILCLLNHKNRLGSEIKSWHDMALKQYYFVDPEPIYEKLDEMEEEGMISSVGPRDGSEPAQKIYQITDNGKEEFNQWREGTRHTRLVNQYQNRARRL
jgi:DNA-binding PadR family transcriptional regulator